MSPAQRETGPRRQGPAPKSASTSNTPKSTTSVGQKQAMDQSLKVRSEYRMSFQRPDWIRPAYRFYTQRGEVHDDVETLFDDPTDGGFQPHWDWLRVERRRVAVVSDWETYAESVVLDRGQS